MKLQQGSPAAYHEAGNCQIDPLHQNAQTLPPFFMTRIQCVLLAFHSLGYSLLCLQVTLSIVTVTLLAIPSEAAAENRPSGRTLLPCQSNLAETRCGLRQLSLSLEYKDRLGSG